MSKKPESKFGTEFMKATQDRVFWTRIESWAIPGVPDLHGVTEGCSFWLELKVSPLVNLTHLDLRPHQIGWQTRYSARGGTVFNLVAHPASHTVKLFRGMSVINGELPMIPDLLYEMPKKTSNYNHFIDFIIGR